jgi:N-acetylglutamate synthase-like GNAT family acetyltransferase
MMPGVGHIRHFVTDPAHLHKGIGYALISRCMDEARAEGLKHVECLSTRAAERFYAAAGCIDLAERDVQLARRVAFPAIEMGRTL